MNLRLALMIVYFLVMNSRRRSRSRRKFRMSDLIAYFPFTIFISRSHVILIPPSSEIAMADPIYAPCNRTAYTAWHSITRLPARLPSRQHTRRPVHSPSHHSSLLPLPLLTLFIFCFAPTLARCTISFFSPSCIPLRPWIALGKKNNIQSYGCFTITYSTKLNYQHMI